MGRCSARTSAPRAWRSPALRGLGAERPGRPGHRRLQRLGRADGHPMRSLGATGVWELLRARGRGRAPATSSGSSAATACGGRRPTRWRSPPRSRRDRLGRVRAREYEWGDDEWMAAARRSSPYTRADEHLRGAPGLVAAGADLPGAGRRSSSSTSPRLGLHPRRVPAGGRAPVRRLVGLPGHRLLRADLAVRRPRTSFRYLVDRLHQAGIGVILDWVPAHFPKDDWALARFDGTPLYEHAGPAARRAPGLGHLHLRLRPPRGAQLPRRQRPVLAARSSTSTGCGSTPSPRCSTSTTRRKDGRVGAQRLRRPGEPRRGRASCRRLNATVYSTHPGVMMIAEESTAWPGVTRPTDAGRAGLRLQVEHGLDARHARATSARTRSTGSTTTTR